MMQASTNLLNACLAGESVNCCGIELFPLTMREYDDYESCKRALLIRQATLPVAYMAMPYLQALFALDADSEGKMHAFGMMLRLLCLVTRRRPDDFMLMVDKNNPKRLKRVIFAAGSVPVELSPGIFAQVRQTIAAMHGDEIPDESENPELVAAETALQSSNAPPLEYSTQTMLVSVAAAMNKRPKELLDWTIFEFKQVLAAKTRLIRHTICGIGEQSGNVKWQHGNPYPCWYLERKREMQAVQALEQFTGRMGISSSVMTTTQ